MSDGAVLSPSQRRSPSTPANRRTQLALFFRGPKTLTKRRTHAAPSLCSSQPSPLASSKLAKSPSPGSRSGPRAQPKTFKSP